MRGFRRWTAGFTAAAVIVLGLGTATSAPAQVAAERVITLAGSLQSELGCPADWDPGCDATSLGTSAPYTKVFDVPAGTYEYKVTVNRAWDENYGAGGVLNGANIPLAIAGSGQAGVQLRRHQSRRHGEAGRPRRADRDRGRQDAGVAESCATDLTKEQFYFVMADRFANGDTANDAGGLTGDRLQTGYDPTDKGFYHGGDLAGLIQKLDYIKGLGTTAIWLTPSFKNRPVQGDGANASAGYHGYWITDFTQIDPHLGTNADMKAADRRAHAQGDEGLLRHHHQPHRRRHRLRRAASTRTSRRRRRPYKDADGNVFDDNDLCRRSTRSRRWTPNTSFPYTPVFRDRRRTRPSRCRPG